MTGLQMFRRNTDGLAKLHPFRSQCFGGKPVVKGTRLSVEFILGLFAAGWAETQILESYPTLTSKDIKAVFAFAAKCMQDEVLYAIA